MTAFVRVDDLVEDWVSGDSALTFLKPASARGASLILGGVESLVLGHLLAGDVDRAVSTVVTRLVLVFAQTSLRGVED